MTNIFELAKRFKLVMKNLNNMASDIENIYAQLNSVNFNAEYRSNKAKEELEIELIKQRGILARRLRTKEIALSVEDVLKEQTCDTFSRDLEWLRQFAPEAFDVWVKLLDVNGDEYEGFPIDSCSVHGHTVGALFKDFVSPYLTGRVLDIGCGPQPIPVYLEEYDPQLTYGIDPLSEDGTHLFNFHRGISERLPYEDNSFNVVMAATSLDHVLLLDKTFEEIRRVLKPGGWFLPWVFFVPGAERYDPYKKEIEAIDKFHLFHFDKDWFEEFSIRYFSYAESVDLTPKTGYQGSFYAFQVGK